MNLPQRNDSSVYSQVELWCFTYQIELLSTSAYLIVHLFEERWYKVQVQH